MIIGIGVDVVDVERFSAAIARTPELVERVFTPRERVTATGQLRAPGSLAARFAVKEAVAKALGAGPGLAFADAEVVSGPHGRPTLVVHGSVAQRADELGVQDWQISMSHDGGVALATVIAQR